jgi:hypothetical protein
MRRTKEESFLVKGNPEYWLQITEKALHRGGFVNVKREKYLHQITGDFKRLIGRGKIVVTLLPQGSNISVHAKSIANKENFLTLFSSSNQRILDQFVRNF